METEKGPAIEIRQGEEVIRIPQARLGALIQTLQRQQAPSVSLPE